MKELIHFLKSNERDVMSTYSALTDESACEVMVSSSWSIKDELAHLVAWLEEFRKEIQFLAGSGGGVLPWEVAADGSPSGYDTWNRLRLSEFEHVSVGELLKRYRASNTALIEFVSQLNGEQLTWIVEIPFEGPRTIPQLISIHREHEQKHVQRSRRALDALAKQ